MTKKSTYTFTLVLLFFTFISTLYNYFIPYGPVTHTLGALLVIATTFLLFILIFSLRFSIKFIKLIKFFVFIIFVGSLFALFLLHSWISLILLVISFLVFIISK